MDEEFLLRLGGGEGEGDGDWCDGFAVAIDEFQLSVVEVENLGRVGAIGGSVGSLVVELDGGTAGMTVGIDGHGVKKIVHDEGHLFAVWRVDGAVFGAGGDGLERSRMQRTRSYLVATSTVRMELVPSRKRLVYGLMVAMATVLPFEEKEGRPGKKVRGASGFTVAGGYFKSKVAPVWS